MKVVHKYPFPEREVELLVDLPLGAGVIHFDLQGKIPTIWATVDPERAERIPRRFRVMATGEPYDENRWEYRGLSLSREGAIGDLVLHLFEARYF